MTIGNRGYCSKLGLTWLNKRLGSARDLAQLGSQVSAHHSSRSGPGSIRLRLARIGSRSDSAQVNSRLGTRDSVWLYWRLGLAHPDLGFSSVRLGSKVEARFISGLESGSLLSHLADLDLAW